jgi:hypothetical protein
LAALVVFTGRMRRLLFAAAVGWLVVTPAGPAAARTTKRPPTEIHSSGHADHTLADRGFVVGVSWRIADHQDVVVRDYGGGPNDPLQRTREIETQVWTQEPIRFDRLVIENHTGAKTRFTISYEDLQTSLGPRPAEVDALTPGTMLALSTVFPSPNSSRTSSSSWWVIPGVVVGPLAFVALLVATFVIPRRRRPPNGSGQRVTAS